MEMPLHFEKYYKRRLHILFEKLDVAKDYNAIKSLVKKDPNVAEFFRHHVLMCGNVFTWNFKKDEPNLLEGIE
jgi:hypothetical protein